MSSSISAHSPQPSLKQQRLLDQAAQKGLFSSDDLDELAASPADQYTRNFAFGCGSNYSCGSTYVPSYSCGSTYSCGSSYSCGSAYVPSYSCGSTYSCGSNYGCGSAYVPSYSCGSTYGCGSNYNDGIGQTVAGQGLRAMFSPSVTHGKDQARIGGQYLNEVAARSSSSNERLVANTAHQAWNQVERWRGQVAASEAALSAISAGSVGGPIGSVLSQVGLSAMFSSNIGTVRDQATVGLVFTSAVHQNTQDPAQRAGAEAALNSAHRVGLARAQVGILDSFLSSQH